MFAINRQTPKLSALQLVRTPSLAKWIARGLFLLLALTLAAMFFAPWQQTARGTGRVIAFAPLERQRTIEAPIYGKITRTADNFVEGATIKKGDFLLEIQDNDPQKLARLKESLAATQRKLETTRAKSEAYDVQVVAYTAALEAAVMAADEMIKAAEQKLAAELQGQTAAEAEELQARKNLERQTQLANEGIKSGLSLEKEQRDYAVKAAKLEQAKSYVEAAKNELEAKKQEREQKQSEASTKVEYAKALYQDALGQIATTEKEILDIETKLSQQQSQTINAPVDGILFRVLANDDTEFIKPGTPLLTIVPESSDLAVELFVNGNDMPLVNEGRHVRLQFEGWPAIQFAGWPSVAVGTFGGKVVAVDATDNGQGEFRVMVQPDDKDGWPDNRYLRQGVRANGWVMLNQVPLGYELWRQLNGFPPTVPEPKSDKNAKKPKLPK